MRVIVNASPLIFLCKSGLHNLLPQVYTEVIVPTPVWDEILAGGTSDPAAQLLPVLGWLNQQDVTTTNQIVTDWNLGAGESSVLHLAASLSGYRVMLDDAAARACAKTLGIKYIGTGGFLVQAKQHGLIPSVSDALNEVIDAGLWISENIIDLLKQQAGE
jgi:predicted nucleic acid-binding protein